MENEVVLQAKEPSDTPSLLIIDKARKSGRFDSDNGTLWTVSQMFGSKQM
jgi:hypothetical protein